MKIVKWIVVAVVSLFVLLSVALFYAYSQLDEARVKTEISKYMAEKYQRHIAINGAISPTLFPLGLSIKGLRLGERQNSIEEALAQSKLATSVDSEKPKNTGDFLSIGAISLSVDTWALLDKQLVVNAVQLSNVRANLIRHKNGEFNFADLMGEKVKPDNEAELLKPNASKSEEEEAVSQSASKKDEPKSFSLRISKVAVSGLTVNFLDEATKDNYRLLDVEINMNDFSPSNLSPFSFSAKVSAKNAAITQLLANINIAGKVLVVLPKGTDEIFSLKVTDLAVKVGANATIDNVGKVELADFSFNGEIAHNASETMVKISDINLQNSLLPITTTGAKGIPINISVKSEGDINASLRGELKPDINAALPKLIFNATGAFGEVGINMQPVNLQFKGGGGQFNVDNLALATNYQAAGDEAIVVNMVLASTIIGVLDKNFQPQLIALKPMSVNGEVTLANLPKPLPIDLTGIVSYTNMKTLSAKIKGLFAESNIDLVATVPNLKAKTMSPQVSLAVDRFNLDNWFPPAAGSTKELKSASASSKASTSTSTANSSKSNDIAIDFSALKGLAGNIKLTIGELIARGINVKKINMALVSDGAKMTLRPLSFVVSEGTFNGDAEVLIEPQQLRINTEVRKVDFGMLLQNLQISDILRGRANLKMALNTKGNSLSEFKQNLAGSINVLVTDGGVKGFNLAKSMRKVNAKLAALKGQAAVKDKANSGEKSTDFGKLSANFTANKGILSTKDIKMLSPFMRLIGTGTVNLPLETLDLRTRVITTSSAIGQGGAVDDISKKGIPVKITGALANPNINIDSEALKNQLLSEKKAEISAKLKQKKEDILSKAQQKIDSEKKNAVKKATEKAKSQVVDKLKNKLKGLFK